MKKERSMMAQKQPISKNTQNNMSKLIGNEILN